VRFACNKISQHTRNPLKVLKNGLHIPTTVVNGVSSLKLDTSSDDDGHKKVLYDKKVINIHVSCLAMDEFFRILSCKTTKEIWNTLETTHEGTR